MKKFKFKKLDPKQIAIAVLSVLMVSGIIAFSMVTYGKNGTIKQQTDTIDSLGNEIITKDIRMQNLEYQKSLLASGMDSLLAKNESLHDALTDIERKYVAALSKIRKLDSALRDKKDEIYALQAKVKERDETIARLSADYGDEIQELVGEKKVWEKNLDTKRKEVDNLKTEKEDLKNENKRLIKEKTQTEKLLEINSIMAHTKVNVVEFVPKNSKNKRIKKVKGDNWNSSILTILLQHKDEELLEGRRFVVKLYDADNNEVLEYLEGGNTDKESTREFEYNKEGNFIEFINYEKKIGKNYRLVLYLVDDSNPDRKFNKLDDKPQLFEKGKPLTVGA